MYYRARNFCVWREINCSLKVKKLVDYPLVGITEAGHFTSQIVNAGQITNDAYC